MPERRLRARAGRARSWPFAVAAGVILAAGALLLGVIAGVAGPPALRRAVLGVDIDGLPAILLAAAAVVAVLAALLIRRWRRRAVLVIASGAVAGAAIGVVLLVFANAQLWFGVALDAAAWAWSIAAFAASGAALATIPWSSWGRRALALTGIVVFVAAGTVGINADIGINRTLADLAGITLPRPIALPAPTATSEPTPTPTPTGPLWAIWHAPVGMPSQGQTGQVTIPPTASGFVARPAGLYLPPAALVPDPPALPLVIMMMGQPGNPDPSFAAAVLNGYAARHEGLAPIVLVVDQIGSLTHDPLCLDTTRYGKARTYVAEDAVAWARSHLHVLQDPAHWVVAGYSNGGECALSLGASYPGIWGNVLDISGEAYAGSDHRARTLADDFHGDDAAYRATYPSAALAKGHYPDTMGVFTVGSNDGFYRAQAQEVNRDAQAAGWHTSYIEIPQGGHVLKALNGGLEQGFAVLYPRLGLSAPGATP